MWGLSAVEVEILSLSLKVAGWSVVASLPLGVLVAWILSRHQFPGRALLDGIIHLPLVLPPVVVGYLLLVLLGRKGPIGGWLHDMFGISLAFSWQGAGVAAGVMAFPLMVRAIRLSLDQVDRNLEQAARTLGAGRVRVFFTITLPLSLPGVIAGTILAFARSLGEFGATITFVSDIPSETRTLPLAIYAQLQSPSGEIGAARLVALSVLVALSALLASEMLSRRSQRRMER